MLLTRTGNYFLFIGYLLSWAVLADRPFVLGMIKIKSKNKPPKPKRIYYVCNRKKCNECVPECQWTSDIEFALYDTHDDFSPEENGMFERIRR